MTTTARPLADGDIEWVSDLFAAHHRDALTPEQRRRHGFVQGSLDADAVRARLDRPGSVVAHVDGRPAGVLLTCAADAVHDGPPARAVALARGAGLQGIYLYGPALVAAGARGHGVLRAMSAAVLAATATRYRTAVAFVEDENTASMDAHTHLGWRRLGTFTEHDRGYTVLTHDLP